jgi:O-antigen/teichoic acid export membrane protein
VSILMNHAVSKSKTVQARIVSGSVVLLSGSGLTAAVNLAYNIVVARSLGAIGFGHVAVVYTLLTILSAATLSFQIVSAKVVAQQPTAERKTAAYRPFHHGAWGSGILVAFLLFLFRDAIAGYLNLPGPELISMLAFGAAFYVPLGSRRGFMQGAYSFLRLAGNLVLEGVVRLSGSILMLHLHFGVSGVVAANAFAIAVAYIGAGSRLGPRVANPLALSRCLREMVQAAVFFSGQVLINNCDVVLVKHFLPAAAAGLFAAVALVGRVISSFSSAVVNTTFPIVAGTSDEGRRDLRVIATSLMLVVGVGSVISLGLFVAPSWVWASLFGSGFEKIGQYHVSSLFAMYACAAIVYSLSAVIITFEMSYKIANTSWIQLAFSGALIAGICRFHSSLREVILVELLLLAALFLLVALPFLFNSLTDPKELLITGIGHPIRLIRRVSEDEVISEFLKNDFHLPAYGKYRETLRPIVARPDLEDLGENAKRRALLLIRHFALWKEIPQGTRWYEVEVNASNLSDIRVFPRAQWRKLAHGSFSITEIAEAMRTRRDSLDAQFLDKIVAIGNQFAQEAGGLGTVILIGREENEPLTVLDGNHRLAAAILKTPEKLDKLRFLCGLSPRMTECCWYNTNLTNLFRYGRNAMMQAIRNPEAEISRLLRDPEGSDEVLEA